jgi:hypothetical protein
MAGSRRHGSNLKVMANLRMPSSFRFSSLFLISVVVACLLWVPGTSQANERRTYGGTGSNAQQAAGAFWKVGRGRHYLRYFLTVYRVTQTGAGYDSKYGPATSNRAGVWVYAAKLPCRIDRQKQEKCKGFPIKARPVPLEDFEFDPLMGSASLTTELNGRPLHVTWTGKGEIMPFPPVVQPHWAVGFFNAYLGLFPSLGVLREGDARGTMFGDRVGAAGQAGLASAAGHAVEFCTSAAGMC